MSKYPDVITEQALEKASGVTDADIQKDINDTLPEISQHEAIYKAQVIIADNSEEQHVRRMAQFRADGARIAAQDRRDFVAYLEMLLKARAE